MRELSTRRSVLVAGLICATLVWLPQHIELLQFGLVAGTVEEGLLLRTSVFIFDLPLLCLVAIQVSDLGRTASDRRNLGVLLLLLLLCAYGVSLAFHPSLRGLAATIRIVMAVGLIGAIMRTRDHRRTIMTVLMGAGLLQALIGTYQSVTGSALGLTGLGETPGPIRAVGESYAARGTMFEAYPYAAFLLITAIALIAHQTPLRRKGLDIALAGLIAAPVALTYSRAGFLAVVSASFALAAVPSPAGKRCVPGATALLVAVGLGIAISPHGWTVRGTQTTQVDGIGSGRETLDAISGTRLTFVSQATSLIREQPVVGVGPGRYVESLAEKLDAPPEVHLYPVHNVVLLAAAEGGIPAGVLVLLLLGWLATEAARRGGPGIALFLVYVPFMFLDHFPLSIAQGIGLTGLWGGLLLSLPTKRRAENASVLGSAPAIT